MKNEHLKKIVIETKNKVEDIISKNQEVSSECQKILDYSDAFLPMVDFLSDQQIFKSYRTFESVQNTADHILNYSVNETSASATSMAGTIAYEIFSINRSINEVSSSHYFDNSLIKKKSEKIDEIFQFDDIVNQAIKLLIDLNLDRDSNGKKSPLSLFKTAVQGYQTPLNFDTPIITSLIPLREAIEESILLLFGRKKHQEPASSWSKRILSIGNQLCFSSIDEKMINGWSTEFDDLLDTVLSPAKKQDISRQEWSDRFRQGTIFLISFLSAIDKEKFRDNRLKKI